jgi:hypothetical protein
MRITDLTDLAHNDELARHDKPLVLEAYRGTAIVEWWSNIDRQITDMIDRYEASRNVNDAEKLRRFHQTWTENELTGSVNIEDITPLKSAAEQLAADNWRLRDYFNALAGQLRKLAASLEELPPLGDEFAGANDKPSADFGPANAGASTPKGEQPQPQAQATAAAPASDRPSGQ